jgi:serine/threonine-protein kinase
MERLEGHTLRDEMIGAPVESRRARWILSGLADAVDAAHARGLLHRDLKPENVFLAAGETGECVKILDFGIARSIMPGADTRAVPTLDGAIVGTPRYMAPEQLATRRRPGTSGRSR